MHLCFLLAISGYSRHGDFNACKSSEDILDPSRKMNVDFEVSFLYAIDGEDSPIFFIRHLLQKGGILSPAGASKLRDWHAWPIN